MASKTRRSVSIKGLTYQRVKRYCEREGLSVSGFLEVMIAARLDGVEPVPDQLEPRTARPRSEPTHAACFTF